MLIAFWAMFLPLGATFSLDRWLAKTSNDLDKRFLSIATIAITLQVCLIYWFSALLKTDPSWRVDGTAVYFALSVDAFAKPFSEFFLANPGLMKFTSFATLYFEGFGPFLLFVPFFSAHFRMLAVLGFIALHTGFALCIELGLFPFVAGTAWLLFIPGIAFDKIQSLRFMEKAKNWFARAINRIIGQRKSPSAQIRYENNFRLPKWATYLAAFSICYVILCNIRTIYEDELSRYYPWHFDTYGIMTGLEQEWSLFAPKPMEDDGWYVMPATFANGEKLDIHSGKPIAWSKPNDVYLTYRSMRWSKYLIDLWVPDQDDNLRQYSQFLCDRWNSQLDDRKKLMFFDIFFMLEPTLPDFKKPEVERLHLWHQTCSPHEIASKSDDIENK